MKRRLQRASKRYQDYKYQEPPRTKQNQPLGCTYLNCKEPCRTLLHLSLPKLLVGFARCLQIYRSTHTTHSLSPPASWAHSKKGQRYLVNEMSPTEHFELFIDDELVEYIEKGRRDPEKFIPGIQSFCKTGKTHNMTVISYQHSLPLGNIQG